MPSAFEITFVRMQERGRCQWDGIFKYNAPPYDPNWIQTSTDYWGITGPPPPSQEITLCTIDLSSSRCDDKCDPIPKDTSRTTSWQLSSTTDYVCVVALLSEEEIDDCVHVTFEIRVWRARLGINPLSAMASGSTGGVVLPGQINLVAGQVPHFTQRVIIEVCCRDFDEIEDDKPLGEAGQPEEVEESDDDCGIVCHLISPR